MKKYMLGLSAIVLAVIASSFTTVSKKAHHRDASLKWFQISSSASILPTSAVPAANATYITDSETPPEGDGCDGSTYLCVAGFRADQVNGSNHLIDNSEVAEEAGDLKGN